MGMAEHDGKVTFDLELDDSRLRGDLSRALSGVKNQLTAQKVKVSVDADTSGAMSQLKGVQSAANDLPTHRTVTVSADTSAADDPLNNVKSRANDIPANRTVTVSAETNSAVGLLDNAKEKADDIPDNVDITVAADTTAADGPLENVRTLANDIPRNVEITVTANTNGAETALSGVTNTAGKAGEAGESAAGAIGKAAAGATILKGAKEIFSAGVSYDYGLAKASTLMPDNADVSAYGKALLGLSKETGVTNEALWESTYNALSASVPFGNAQGDNMINFLRTSIALSKGGYADADEVTKVLASMGNAYHQRYTPEEIGNIAIKTQNKGQLSVADIVQSAPSFVSSSATAHVPLEESMAMFAAMTLGGVQPAQSGTAIGALFRELDNPKSETFKTMQAAFSSTQYKGKDLKGLMDSGVTMLDVLSTMDQYMTSKKIAPGSVLPGEAKRAYDTLTGENTSLFQGAYQYIMSDEDAMSKAFGTMTNTTQSRMDRLKSGAGALMAGIAETLKPATNYVMDSLIALMNHPEDIPSEITGGANPGLYLDLNPQKFSGFRSNEEWLKMYGVAQQTGKWGGQTRTGGGGGSGETSSGAGRGSYGIDTSKRGDRDTDSASVAEAQAALIKLGYDLVGEIDGIFGPKTQAGVEAFQKSKGLDVSGAIDEATAAALIDAVNAVTESTESMSDGLEGASTSLEGAAESTSQMAASAETAAQNEATAATATGSAAKSASNGAARAAALASRVSSLNSKLGSASSAAAGLPGAISGLISSVRAAGAKVQAPTATKYAVGLDYVPYDNYPAILHKGEMVLTAAQASAFRFGGAGSSGGGIDAGALASAMAGLSVEMDGRVVGRLVERSVSAQQAVRLNRTQYGRD